MTDDTMTETGSEQITGHVLLVMGSHMRYRVFNESRPQTIVMIHGFRGNYVGLMPTIKFLSGYRVIIPDLPGSGDSTPMPDTRHDIDGYANCMTQFIRELKLERPNLLGHSFGTIIAAKIAADQPGLINKLILVSPIALRQADASPARWLLALTRFYYWLGCTLPGKLGQLLLSSRLFVRVECYLLIKTPDKQARRETYAYHLQHISQHHIIRVVRESFEASITRAAIDYAPRIISPTLIVAGGADNVAPLATQQQLEQQIPQAQLVVIEKTGHLAHIEAPQKIAQAIESFLA